MNIFFPHQLVLYLIFVDWDQVARRLKHYFPFFEKSFGAAATTG
jgi:hypothetical protein